MLCEEQKNGSVVWQPRIVHRPLPLRGLQNTALGPTTSSNGGDVNVRRVSTWSVRRATSGAVQVGCPMELALTERKSEAGGKR